MNRVQSVVLGSVLLQLAACGGGKNGIRDETPYTPLTPSEPE